MKGISRRGFLALGGAAGAAGVVAALRFRRSPGLDEALSAAPSTSTTPAPARRAGTVTSSSPGASKWSAASSWPNGVPGPDEVAVVAKTIVLDTDARVAGVVIEPGGQLVFDPRSDRSLESTGNIVVRGRLTLRPASATVHHRLAFADVRESGFAGSGMDVVAGDVGLWIMDSGQLDLAGAPKLAWSRVSGAVSAGATTITLQADPVGWRGGDELVLTPTLEVTDANFATAFESVRVRSIKGRVVILDRPIRLAHPSIDLAVAPGGGLTGNAEVLNLTRNVMVEGTPAGRTHIFIRSGRPQSLRSTVIRHVGPRHDRDGGSTFVAGRYGVHFHMAGTGSRGSVVDGVVVRDSGSHSFVAHESHGVTFRNCVAFDVLEDAYWWDGPPGTSSHGSTKSGSISDDITYERCVAALVRFDPANQGYNLTGFRLGRGAGNSCRDCVAVGVQGNVNASGFEWGENEEGPGVWAFRGNVAHNNARHGIFWWQVTTRRHTVVDFLAYRNGGAGIFNGSYGDNTHFERCTLVQNAETQFFGWAESFQGDPGSTRPPQQVVDSVMDSAGLNDYACILAGRAIPESNDSVGYLKGNVFRGARKACVAVTFDFHDFGPHPTKWRLEGNTYQGNQYWFDGSSHPESTLDTEFGTLRLADHSTGTFRPAWNAKVTSPQSRRNPAGLTDVARFAFLHLRVVRDLLEA